MKSLHNLTIRSFCYLTALFVFSCTSFVEVDLPKSQLATSAVFEDYSTASAALLNIYANIRDKGIITGTGTGISNQLGNYADEIQSNESPTNPSINFYKNSLLPTNTVVSGYWNASYSQIYAANAIIEGIAKSKTLTAEQKKQLEGEALFIRALSHFYLTNLFGDIPYITDTDYKKNSTAIRISTVQVYEKMVSDLENAVIMLPANYLEADRTRPNSRTASALLARVHLFKKEYPQAANAASSVLNNDQLYSMEPLDKAFFLTSHETIWQLQSGAAGRNTAEASYFTFTSVPPPLVSLSTNLVNSFEIADLRRSNWIKTITKGTLNYYHVYKYKENGPTSVSKEYSIVFRIAEQYLIRSEARVFQGDFIGAKEDLNKIRNRAGLGNTTAQTEQEILNAIQDERRHEFFTEYGHRFFDLKRMGRLDSVLGTSKPGWDTTDNLFPLPQSELSTNPALGNQNPGY